MALDFGGGFGFDFSSVLAFEDRVALDRCSAMQLSGRRSGLGRGGDLMSPLLFGGLPFSILVSW